MSERKGAWGRDETQSTVPAELPTVELWSLHAFMPFERDNMEKKRVSLTLPESLVETIDEISENRSNFFAKAALEIVDDVNVVKDQIDQEKNRRDELMEEKQRIERELEESRDRIRELEDLKTRVKTLSEVKNQIPDKEIHRVRRTVRDAKYDTDARGPAPEQVLEHNVERFSEKYELREEKVEEVLRITTEV